jgi:chemotaxis protein methyltransferase CheR
VTLASIPALEPRVAELTTRDFDAFRSLILEHAGIQLSDAKRALLYGRLARRVRELGLSTFADYHRRIAQNDDELVQMLDRVTTNETHFFREPHHFSFLERDHLPKLVAAAEAGERSREIRVWSAGCSSGEEPYSIAMTLLEHLPSSWTVEILATDLSTRVLDVARRATWPIGRAHEIGDSRLRRHMLRGVGSQVGFIRAQPELRALVRVERHNLNDAPPSSRAFDLVFCRNVLIYFHPERRRRALLHLVDSLVPGGVLFVGHAESVQGMSDRVRPLRPTIYARQYP